MKGSIVRMTRNSKRVFAQKTRPVYSNIRQQFVMRGGGWL